MGHEAIRTPHLDKLAAESMVYTRGYVPTALCRPSLATIMTGLYPHQHGLRATIRTARRGTPRTAPAWWMFLRSRRRSLLCCSNGDTSATSPASGGKGQCRCGGFHPLHDPRGRRARRAARRRGSQDRPRDDAADLRLYRGSGAKSRSSCGTRRSCRIRRTIRPNGCWRRTARPADRRRWRNTTRCASGSTKRSARCSAP